MTYRIEDSEWGDGHVAGLDEFKDMAGQCFGRAAVIEIDEKLREHMDGNFYHKDSGNCVLRLVQED